MRKYIDMLSRRQLINCKLDDLFGEGHFIAAAAAICAKIMQTKIYLNNLKRLFIL
jgi:hypothetical protein